ncbi:MAG: redoxin domain-containing protein [Pirellulales bacterium]
MDRVLLVGWRATLLVSVCLVLVARSAAAGEPKTLAIGSAAPDFSLPGVDPETHADKTYTLADFADAKLLVIVFTCNHCPTAQAYEERIKQLAVDYRDRGVAVVAVSPNDAAAVRLDELGYTDLGDSFEDMKTRAKDHHFDFPYLYDGQSQSMSRAYGPVATPHVFIFDSDRKLRFCGRIDDHENPAKTKTHDTRNAIDALLAGKAVPVETTRTFGCSIKWSDKRKSAADSLAKWDEEPAELKTIDAAGLRELVANKSDKLRVINVWATWCGPCVTEFPDLVTIHRMYRNRDFELVTITADAPENREAALKFLNRQHASSTNYIFDKDDPYALADALGVEWPGGLPFTLVVKPGGEVAYSKIGPIDPLELRRAIVDQLSRYYFKPGSP